VILPALISHRRRSLRLKVMRRPSIFFEGRLLATPGADVPLEVIELTPHAHRVVRPGSSSPLQPWQASQSAMSRGEPSTSINPRAESTCRVVGCDHQLLRLHGSPSLSSSTWENASNAGRAAAITAKHDDIMEVLQ
jgi:hypothetical protein